MPLDSPVDQAQLIAFCQRWKVIEFSLFGSAVRDDFDPARSDVDVLVEFAPGAGLDFFELLTMSEELEAMFGRRVDLVTKRSLRPRLRESVLQGARVLYAA
ncbi:MAG: nucleotidyltransferase family protein [Candidatus Sericytochromatia bacterium]|nr:nucleotidyltransferase family protein [Candidatus Sericytochromatia bacterium]